MRLIIAAGMMIFSLAVYAAPDKMRGVQVGDGGSLSVQELPVPRAGVAEVLIKVRAAGVNPVDWKVATRRLGQVPGTDVAGVIDTLGEGVTGWKVGDQVMGFARQSGSYAEYAVVPVTSLARKPRSMTFEEAAGVPIAAETAYRALHGDSITVGQMLAQEGYCIAKSGCASPPPGPADPGASAGPGGGCRGRGRRCRRR